MTLANPCARGTVDVYANDFLVLNDLTPESGGFYHANFTANAIDDQIALRLVSDSLSSPWNLAMLEVYPATESDADGIPDAIEDEAPNDGDGNSDGIPDRLQPNVASLPNGMTGTYITLAVPDGMNLENVSAVLDPLYVDRPSGFEFPLGFIDFTVSGITPGGAVDVAAYTQALSTSDVFILKGHARYPSGPDFDPEVEWYVFSYDGTTGAEFFSDRIVLHFIDGQRGDEDETEDGSIRDPFGIAVLINTMPWQNPADPYDVNNDGDVTSLDALVVINQISRLGGEPPYALPVPPQPPDEPPPFYDVDGNNQLSALDALRVINRLGVIAASEWEADNQVASKLRQPPVDALTLIDVVAYEVEEELSPSEANAVSIPLDLPPRVMTLPNSLFTEAVDEIWSRPGLLDDPGENECLPIEALDQFLSTAI
jgi:hypothetical protein